MKVEDYRGGSFYVERLKEPALVDSNKKRMRTLICSILFVGLLAAHTVRGETGRSVHLRPTADSPVIGKLPQDGFFMAPPESVSLSEREKNEGWEAISFLDDFRGFVKRTDVTKDLRVAPGSVVYISAAEDSSRILTRAHANDLFEVEKLAGEWAEVSFRKPVTGFLRPGESKRPAPVATREVARTELSILDDTPPAPQAQAAHSRVISDRAGIPTDGILRAFEGRLGQPRSFFGRSPPHAYQIVDASGNRIAYLDLSRLLITTPLEHFLGREFHFYGRAEAIEGRRDFVIRVEQMRQR